VLASAHFDEGTISAHDGTIGARGTNGAVIVKKGALIEAPATGYPGGCAPALLGRGLGSASVSGSLR